MRRVTRPSASSPGRGGGTKGTSAEYRGIEAEDDGEHVVPPAVWEGAERPTGPGRLDGASRLEIEGVVAGALHEAHIGHRTVALYDERELRGERQVGIVRLEVEGDLTNDIAQVPGIRELDPLRAHGDDVGAAPPRRAATGLRRLLRR